MTAAPGRLGGPLACLLLLVACASALDHPAPGGPSYESDDVRFVAPTGWEVQPSTEISYGPSWRVLYVANQPLHEDCVVDAVGVTCHPPVDGALRRGGFLVIWFAHTCVAKGCDLPPGPLMAIGNRHGVRAAVTDGCEDVGYTERSAYYVTVTPQRVDLLLTCADGPSDGTRSAFLGFLDAIQWRIP
jgi:hypothetical protein